MTSGRRAFTLVEMVTVLAVIAILTHLAVHGLSRVRDGKLAKAADRQLETIRASVYDSRPGEEAVGFLADMGRLPRLANGSTLGELWEKPAGALPYAVRPATVENLVAGLDAISDGSVYVPTGWRGPYLRLPFGKTRLFDPWGNPMELEDDAGLVRLWATNDVVYAVSHYGPRARDYGPRARAKDARTIGLAPEGVAASRLVVSAESADVTFSGDITYTWYGPADGLITGAVKTVRYPAAAVFEGLAPGRRILKDSRSGRARTIDVKPGDNLVSIKLP